VLDDTGGAAVPAVRSDRAAGRHRFGLRHKERPPKW